MGPPLPEYAQVKEAPLAMLVGMGILAVLIIAFGFFPQLVVDTLVTPAAHALIDQGSYLTTILGGA
jgi:multicomponent Na+:H+ antiporter subunit D